MLMFRRFLVGLSCLLLATIPVSVSAATSKNSTNSSNSSSSSSNSSQQSVIQGYAADSSVQQGMIVMLESKNPGQVQPLDSNDADNMLGVVVAANDATVALSNQANSGQVYVATFGRYNVLVSNQNGPIKAGDYITISALAGVGMKVDSSQPIVLGRAAGNFDGSGNVDSTAQLKTTDGSKVTVSIGRIPVDISISHNPLMASVDKGVPSFLREAGQQVAGKQVGASRIYVSLLVLVVASFLAGNTLYSGIRGGLIAIGRNPLAKKSIIAGIFRVVLAGIIVFMVGLFGVYLILRL